MGKQFKLEQIPNMTGKVCIITGGNTGIGKVCALELAEKNAHVIIASRTSSKALAAIEEIKAESKNEKIEFIQAKELPLHLLINNAGMISWDFALSEDGIESQFATNHLAHFYLTTQLLPVLEKSQSSRVVNVASDAHKLMWFGLKLDSLNDESKYNRNTAYSRSKSSNILFTRELNQRFQRKNVYVNCNHPGIVRTDITDQNGPFLSPILRLISIEVSNGAVTQMYLATSPEVEANDIRGQYYIPYGESATPAGHATSQENQTKLWDLSEKYLFEKVPGYTGASM